jgi:hypothetical protein
LPYLCGVLMCNPVKYAVVFGMCCVVPPLECSVDVLLTIACVAPSFELSTGTTMHALLEAVQRVFSLRSVPWLYISDNKAACAFGDNIKLQQNQLTDSMKQNPYSEATSSSATQEFPNT